MELQSADTSIGTQSLGIIDLRDARVVESDIKVRASTRRAQIWAEPHIPNPLPSLGVEACMHTDA